MTSIGRGSIKQSLGLIFLGSNRRQKLGSKNMGLTWTNKLSEYTYFFFLHVVVHFMMGGFFAEIGTLPPNEGFKLLPNVPIGLSFSLAT